MRQGIQPVVRPRFCRTIATRHGLANVSGRPVARTAASDPPGGAAEPRQPARSDCRFSPGCRPLPWPNGCIGLEIEDRGWKGRAASSVLKSPGMFDFYLEQARRAALGGQLRLVFLELDGVPIAFEYGWLSKGIYFSPKVAYDEAYAQLSPGELLRAELVERFHADRSCESIDYLGPSSATADWSTSAPRGAGSHSDHPDRPHRPGGLRNAAANLATTHRPACSRPASIDRGRAREPSDAPSSWLALPQTDAAASGVQCGTICSARRGPRAIKSGRSLAAASLRCRARFARPPETPTKARACPIGPPTGNPGPSCSISTA